MQLHDPFAIFLSIGLSAFAVSCLLTRFLTRSGSPIKILDYPNERSLHNTPTPRTGGLAIWVGSMTGVAIVLATFGMSPSLGLIGTAALLVGLVSVADDRYRVPVALRLLIHLFSGGLLVAGGLEMSSVSLPGFELRSPVGVGLVLTVLYVVWVTNLYNFMDGMDGFAGGMAAFGFGTLGLLGLVSGDGYFAAICWAIAAAAGGFLIWNFPPARIFMGDTGASVLGLMAAALSLWGDRLGLFPLWIAILVFSPFIVDATVTLIRRVARRERIWEAHRSHHYQRLVRLGWGHRKTVLVEYLLMAGCSITAIVLLKASPTVQWLGLFAWGFVYAIGICAVARLEASAR